jgi:prepilin-type N-terminal cleavage/methylation domain-containing protein
MRKAFTLVELLAVVAVAPTLLVIISGVYATFIRDIPRTTRTLQVNTTVLDALRQMSRDVDGALELPQQWQDQQAGERTLLIAQPGRVIRYQVEEGRLVRTVLDSPSAAEQRVWRVPAAVIAWRLWVRDGRAYAVEIHSHVKEWVGHRQQEKLAASRVCFLHGLALEGEIQ